MNADYNNLLDVTVIEPKQKHPMIFNRFDQLGKGESLTILNDHDPKPLYYQILGERGNIFSWEYLERGPVWWKVIITKRNDDQGGITLGQIAAEDIRKVSVFKKYGLDFCCGGSKTLKEACIENGIMLSEIEKELGEIAFQPGNRDLPYNDWNLSFLTDYIVNTHHSYVRKALPEMVYYSAKVFGVHGNDHPELKVVQRIVGEINVELNAHMMKEEKILFPYIKALESSEMDGNSNFESHLGTVRNPINMMEMEHEIAGNSLKELKTHTHNYEIPEDACESYKHLYRLLPQFEADLLLHIHLENNILFPKAIDLEKKIKG